MLQLRNMPAPLRRRSGPQGQVAGLQAPPPPGPVALPIAPADFKARRRQNAASLQLSLASSAAERAEAQRLRYFVFAQEMGARIGCEKRHIDEDEFDEACDHLLVRERASGQVVGTYRLLPPGRRGRAGTLYADTEFDLSPLARLLPTLVEVGRSCVHPNYRTGPSLMLLWAGLTRYMLHGRHEHLLGCASASLADGGHQAATLRDHLQQRLVEPALRVRPHVPFAHESLTRAAVLTMPPLIKGYLRAGARICGEPAWDARFGTADFLVWLSMRNMEPRYARHFKLSQAGAALDRQLVAGAFRHKA